MLPDIASVSIRGIGFVLLFQAIGAAFFVALSPDLGPSAAAIRRLTIVSAVGGIAAISAHWALETARMTGDFAGVLDASMRLRVFNSSVSTAHALPIMGLTLIVVAAWRRDRLSIAVSCIGGAIAVSGFVFVGHTSIHPWRALLGPLLICHLLIVAFWFGALLPLWAVISNEPSTIAANALKEFSDLATRLVPAIAIIGVVMMLLVAHGVPPVDKPYGALIAAKIGGFALLMALAALNKWKLVPSFLDVDGRSSMTLRRTVLIEYGLIIVVLGLTAIMTTFYSPDG